MIINETQEYLAENALTTYPFKDSCRLLFSSGVSTIVLPNNLLVDAQITLSPQFTTASRAVLYRVQRSRVGNLFYGFTINIYGRDTSVPPVKSVYITTYTTLERNALITYQDAECAIKLVVGSFFDDYRSPAAPLFNYTSQGVDQSEFEASVVRHIPTIVNSVSFQNTTDNVKYDTVLKIDSGDVNLNYPAENAGTNVVMDLDDTDPKQCDVDVTSGAGAGLYDECQNKEEGVIRKINNIGVDALNQNYILEAYDCYSLQPIINGLKLIELCKPKCSPEELQAYAFYVNRVRAVMNDLADRVNTTRSQILDIANQYKAKIESMVVVLAPYLEVADVSTSGAQNKYYSIATGIYNPRKHGDEYLSLIVQPSVGMEYVAGTSLLKDHDSTIRLPWIGFNSYSIGCLSSLEYDVVFSVNTEDYSDFANGYVHFYLLEENVDRPSAAYKFHTIEPNAAYFHLKFKKQWDLTALKYFYVFSVDMFDVRPSAGVGSLSLNFPLPTGLTVRGDTYQATFNNITTDIPVGTNRSIVAFARNDIDITKRTNVTFAAEAATSLNTSALVRVIIRGSTYVGRILIG